MEEGELVMVSGLICDSIRFGCGLGCKGVHSRTNRTPHASLFILEKAPDKQSQLLIVDRYHHQVVVRSVSNFSSSLLNLKSFRCSLTNIMIGPMATKTLIPYK